jgi:hypothetical protein
VIEEGRLETEVGLNEAEAGLKQQASCFLVLLLEPNHQVSGKPLADSSQSSSSSLHAPQLGVQCLLSLSLIFSIPVIWGQCTSSPNLPWLVLGFLNFMIM